MYDDGRNLIDCCVGPDATETLTVADAGSYFVAVLPASGATNYVLTIGQTATVTGTTNQNANWTINAPFVPYEALLELPPLPMPTASPDPLSMMPSLGVLETSGAIARASVAIGPMSLPGNVTDAQRAKYETLHHIKTLAMAHPDRHIEPNYRRYASAVPDDSLYGVQWHYQNINLPLAWDVTVGLGGTPVVVAVIDTGVLLAHVDLQGQLVDGYDFISDADAANDGDGIDPDPDDPGDLSQGGSSSFHGTHVAGTIAALTDNDAGVAGVAWDAANVMPLRALGIGGGTSFDIIEAVQYAAGFANSSGTVPAVPADIINLSLGSTTSSQNEQTIFDAVRAAGVIVVAAAGNDGTSLPSYPAAYSGVISVSATTITNSIAPYSNFGTSIDVAAPGGYGGTDVNGDGLADAVFSTLGSDGDGSLTLGYGGLTGTSMAAPHVAGVLALMKTMHPGLTPAEVDVALVAGALTDDYGPAGVDDDYGWGLINAQKAVSTAIDLANGTGPDPGPVLAATPASLNFGLFEDTLFTNVLNIGTGNTTITATSTSETWLSVAESDVDIDGLGTYAISVDRTGLADNTYAGEVTFTSAEGDLVVPVIMQESSLDLSANAGLHWVLALQPGASTGTARAATLDQGQYTFTWPDLEPGIYSIFAGTDADEDGQLCDGGEACGAYQTLDAPSLITVNDDVTGIDFVSGFRSNIATQALSDSTTKRGLSFVRQGQSHPVDLPPRGLPNGSLD